MSYDGFIYLWENNKTGMKYVGSHKGTIDDGYVSSSKYFMYDYNTHKADYVRTILEYVTGDIPEIREIETYWLRKLECSERDDFFNRSSSAFGASMAGVSNPMFGIEYTDERRAKQKATWDKKISDGYEPYNKGSTMSNDQRINLSDEWEVHTPSGEVIIVTNMRQFCKEHCLNPSTMSSVARGKRRMHKGFRCKKITNKRNVDYVPCDWESKGRPGKPHYGSENGMSKSITVNGKIYESMKAATEDTGLSRYKLRKIHNERD